MTGELAALDNNVYGFLHNVADPQPLAHAFVRLGWSARWSAEDEYEVECSWCRLNLWNSGGMAKFAGVVEPASVNRLAETLGSLGVDHEIELYDVEGVKIEPPGPEP
ncbi:hypothetical protein [Actinoplanes sp. TFC3]|uniref:hypothetical protein n=1 Tax=Actinoplanes sp. TFC3 TaxID=1710355 RepID=UPI000835A522|nr:hypothetical protein [Actinoplanes sp. TFC3]